MWWFDILAPITVFCLQLYSGGFEPAYASFVFWLKIGPPVVSLLVVFLIVLITIPFDKGNKGNCGAVQPKDTRRVSLKEPTHPSSYNHPEPPGPRGFSTPPDDIIVMNNLALSDPPPPLPATPFPPAHDYHAAAASPRKPARRSLHGSKIDLDSNLGSRMSEVDEMDVLPDESPVKPDRPTNLPWFMASNNPDSAAGSSISLYCDGEDSGVTSSGIPDGSPSDQELKPRKSKPGGRAESVVSCSTAADLSDSDYSALHKLPSTIEKMKRSSRNRKIAAQLEQSMRVIERAMRSSEEGTLPGASIEDLETTVTGPSHGAAPDSMSHHDSTITATSQPQRRLSELTRALSQQQLQAIVSDIDTLVNGIERWASDQNL